MSREGPRNAPQFIPAISAVTPVVSGPNTTDDRRIGVAIRYIKPSMKQQSGDLSLVAHVSGEDRFEHFKVASSPKDRLQEEDLELCRRDAEIKRRVLYEGADASRGKRY